MTTFTKIHPGPSGVVIHVFVVVIVVVVAVVVVVVICVQVLDEKDSQLQLLLKIICH